MGPRFSTNAHSPYNCYLASRNNGTSGLEINIMTYIVPTLLFIIGIGDAIHIQARFRENFLMDTSNPEKAMLKTISQMSRVIFLTSITTSLI